jgi:hypothetical protein
MQDSISNMTRDDLRDLLESVVEQKLVELLGDPDGNRELRADVIERLKHQQQAVANGERGRSLDEVTNDLGLGSSSV